MTAGNAENCELQNSHLSFQELTQFFSFFFFCPENSIIQYDYVTLWQADLVSCYTFLHLKESLEERKRVYFHFCCISKKKSDALCLYEFVANSIIFICKILGSFFFFAILCCCDSSVTGGGGEYWVGYN
jgi:hypothetical protein